MSVLPWRSDAWYINMFANTKRGCSLLKSLLTHHDAKHETKIIHSGDVSVRESISLRDGRLRLDFGDSATVLANAQSPGDWYYLLLASQCCPTLPRHRCWTSRLVRTWRLARAHARRGKVGHWTVVFPEDELFSQESLHQDRYEAERDVSVPTYTHLLVPSLSSLIQPLEGADNAAAAAAAAGRTILDVTIGYVSTRTADTNEDRDARDLSFGSLWSGGAAPDRVHLHWRALTRPTTLTDEWLHALWREKDDLMDDFKVNGAFNAVVSVATRLDRRHRLVAFDGP